MLNYTDIIRKTIAGTPDPAALPIWDPGYDLLGRYAWIHPDGCSILFLTEEEFEQYGLKAEHVLKAHWLSEQLRSAVLIKPEDLVPESHVFHGKKCKFRFNHTVGTPSIVDDRPIADKFVKRYSYKHSLLYQSMEKPCGYFFTTENGTPYAFVMPCAILLATSHDWRL